jgi:hypothetical protein
MSAAWMRLARGFGGLAAIASCAAPARPNTKGAAAAPSSTTQARVALSTQLSTTATPTATSRVAIEWPTDLVPANTAQLSATAAASSAAALDLSAAVDRCIALRIDASAPARVSLQVGASQREYVLAAGSVLLGDGARHCIGRGTAASLRVTSGNLTATALVTPGTETMTRSE